MMDNFLQPGLLMIITGLLTLITGKEILRRVIFIAGPVITLCAVAISGADKLTTMFGIIFSLIAVVAAIYNINVKDRLELAAEAIYAGSSISAVSYTHLTLPTILLV